MPPRVKLELYYDVGSSYSYLAYEVLLRYEEIWNLDWEIFPVSRRNCNPRLRVLISHGIILDIIGWGFQVNR
jgi:hypothetical protein